MSRRRPPPPEPPERHTEGLRVQLTPTARAALEARAAQSGLNLSQYARKVLLSETQAQPAPRPSTLAIRALAAQFGRLGNNINQLARWANERDGALPAQKTLEEMALILRLCAEKVLSL